MAKNSSLGFLLSFDSTNVHKKLKNLRTEFGEFNKSAKETGDTIKSAFSTTSIIAFAIAIKNLTQAMIKASKAETEYIENMNLLQNAYDGNMKSAEKLINTMTDFYGLDASGVTRQLGTYRQMSSALGITADKANLLSENMIKLQEDVSSLYNISNDLANSKLTSALTGQTKPIRALGADITEASLQQELYNRGINKSVKEMNRATKTVLIYLAMERQLINANGDASRTINSVANQSRIFTEQIKIAGRQLGAVFIPVLRTLLPILNGVLMALNAIGGILLGLLGIDATKLAKEFGIGMSTIDDGLDDITNGANSASDAVKKLQLGLRSFDKLNVIKTPSESKSGSGSGTALGGVDSDVLKSLKEYNQQLEKAKNKATEIRDKIMEWLGFTKKVDEETGKITWKFDHITGGTVLGALTIGGSIFIGASKLLKVLQTFGILDFSKIASSIKTVAEVIGTLGSGTTIAITAVGALLAMWVVAIKRNKDLQKSIKNIGKNLIDIGKGLADLAKNIIDFGHTVDKYLKPIITQVLDPIIVAIKELYYWWELTFKQCAIVTESITGSISKLLKGDLKGAFKDIIEGLKNLLKNWKEYWSNLKDRVVEKVKEILDEIWKLPNKVSEVVKDIFDKLIEKVTETDWQEVGKKIVKFIGDGLSDAKNIVEITKKAVKKIFESIKEKCTTDNGDIDWVGIGKTILKTILTCLFLANPLIMWGTIAVEIISGIIKGMVESLTDSKNIEKLKGAFKSLFKSAVNGAIEIWNKFTDKLNNSIEAIKKAYQAVKDFDVKKAGKTVINTIKKIDLFADGGFPDRGDMFVMNEKEPEFLGSINGRTAVANNDQIVDAISIGVAKAMSNAKTNQNVIIEAKGDTQGLMNFITFEQKNRDRQFGL